MTTLSQLVDEILNETRRPDMRRDIIDYVNQTVREVHNHPANNAVLMYNENLVEELLTASVDSGFGWDIPDPATFQAMQAVQYRSADVWPDPVTPSRGIQGRRYYYYRAGRHYSFAGYGGQNSQIAIAYYQFPRVLSYFPLGSRPAEYDVNQGWTYAPQFADVALHPAAESYVTNWLLMRWSMVIKEGVRAKVYKRVGDMERSRTSFSLFQSLRMGLATSESADLGGFG